MEYDKVYDKLLAFTKLPRDIVQDAARNIYNELTRITLFLCFQAKESHKPSLEYWKEYEEQHFEAIKGDVVYDEYAQRKYRVCTISFHSLIRQDLTNQARQLIERTISSYIQKATYYVSAFSIQLLKIALVFSSHEFISIEITVARPLDTACLSSQAFKSAFDLLFEDVHFNLIYLSLYGIKGSTPGTLKQQSVRQLISEALGFVSAASYHYLSCNMAKVVLLSYCDNVHNMLVGQQDCK